MRSVSSELVEGLPLKLSPPRKIRFANSRGKIFRKESTKSLPDKTPSAEYLEHYAWLARILAERKGIPEEEVTMIMDRGREFAEDVFV